jgi:hypothetical protein
MELWKQSDTYLQYILLTFYLHRHRLPALTSAKYSRRPSLRQPTVHEPLGDIISPNLSLRPSSTQIDDPYKTQKNRKIVKSLHKIQENVDPN